MPGPVTRISFENYPRENVAERGQGSRLLPVEATILDEITPTIPLEPAPCVD